MLTTVLGKHGHDETRDLCILFHFSPVYIPHLLVDFPMVSLLARTSPRRILPSYSDTYAHTDPQFRGFVGSPTSVVISYWFLFFILAGYTWLSPAARHAWAGLSFTTFEDLGLNIRYGLAGVISTCSEWSDCLPVSCCKKPTELTLSCSLSGMLSKQWISRLPFLCRTTSYRKFLLTFLRYHALVLRILGRSLKQSTLSL